MSPRRRLGGTRPAGWMLLFLLVAVAAVLIVNRDQRDAAAPAVQGRRADPAWQQTHYDSCVRAAILTPAKCSELYFTP